MITLEALLDKTNRCPNYVKHISQVVIYIADATLYTIVPPTHVRGSLSRGMGSMVTFYVSYTPPSL